MARRQKYGISYPFSINNEDMVYIDLNDTYDRGIASQVMHVILTPKGQRLRDPDFGTDLIKYIFEPSDSTTFDSVKSEITSNVSKYVPGVKFIDLELLAPSDDEHAKVVNIKYSVRKGMSEELKGISVSI